MRRIRNSRASSVPVVVCLSAEATARSIMDIRAAPACFRHCSRHTENTDLLQMDDPSRKTTSAIEAPSWKARRTGARSRPSGAGAPRTQDSTHREESSLLEDRSVTAAAATPARQDEQGVDGEGPREH